MVILHLSPDDFFNYLKENGCEQCCDEYLNENVIVFKKGEEEIPIQIQKTDDIIIAIANSAKGDSAASQKLWFQIMEGWTEKQVMEHEGGMTIKDAREKLIEKLTDLSRNNRSIRNTSTFELTNKCRHT